MKILFYDINNIELNYFLENTFKLIEPYYFDFPLNSKTFIDKKFKDTEAISVFVQSDLNKNVLSQFENLKYIFLRSTGYSNVDLKYCKNKNIKTFNIPDYGTDSVAEYAFGLILAISRNILKANLELKKGEVNIENLTGFELKNKTLGVVGAGKIGKRVIEIASAFKMNTLIYDIKKDNNYNYATLDKLLKESDFIVLCCPLNESTKYLINQNAISKMKNNAYLINIARGEIIKTESLYDNIIKRKIKGAALDVIECENTICKSRKDCIEKETFKLSCVKKYLFSSKLLQMENIIITPHIAYNTYEAKNKIVKTTIENIKSVFDINSSPKNLVLI